MYAAPRATDPTPRAVALFRLYAGALAAAYLAAAVLLVVLAVSRAAHGSSATPLVLPLAFLSALHVAAVFAPRAPWGWTLGTVVLVLGTTSCFVPIALPLLVAWQKPLVKAAYRRV